MAKKSSVMSYLYLIGLALVVVGFLCPMFKGSLTDLNGFDFLNFEDFGFVTIGGLLIFIGAIAGVVLNFVKIKNAKMLKLVSLIVSIAGGVILVIGFNDNGLYKFLAKGLLKHAYIGFYVVIVGWIVALLGHFSSK
ncbi:MAG: hypothetical protein IJ312_06215 [Treponema sp.]|nr:hypothetical protein [Treponema sp.]